MPPGRVHAASNLGMLIVELSTTDPWEIKLFTGLGLALGVILSPDLDVNDGYIGLYVLRKLHLPWMLWRGFWWPYSMLVPHRSPISHWPILGTAIRIVYLGLPIAIIKLVFFHAMPLHLIQGEVTDILIGLLWSDTMHFILDMYNPDV